MSPPGSVDQDNLLDINMDSDVPMHYLLSGNNEEREVAAKALDFPQTKALPPQEESKEDVKVAKDMSPPVNEEANEERKPVIGDHFYCDWSLGLVNDEDEINRQGLA